MKITQMKFQKIAVKFLFILAILTVAYSLIMSSQLYYPRMEANVEKLDTVIGENNYNRGICLYANELFVAFQPFNKTMFSLTIAFLLISLTLFVFFCQSRRKYYVTNYVAIAVVSVFAIVLSVYALSNIFFYKSWYQAVDPAAIQKEYDLFNDLAYTLGLIEEDSQRLVVEFSTSTWSFNMGIVLYILLIISAIMLIANAVWKFIAMKKDKKEFGEIDSQIRDSWAKHEQELMKEANANES